jgi:hypothetical protein
MFLRNATTAAVIVTVARPCRTSVRAAHLAHAARHAGELGRLCNRRSFHPSTAASPPTVAPATCRHLRHTKVDWIKHICTGIAIAKKKLRSRRRNTSLMLTKSPGSPEGLSSSCTLLKALGTLPQNPHLPV